ncbi:MAG: hypothetical protein ACYCQI_03050 [Gammaproteobacteria bacterium]
MLSIFIKLKEYSLRFLSLTFLFTLSCYSHSAYAIQANIETMIKNLGTAVPNLMQLVTALAYIIGMFMIAKGIIGLKEYGESRTSRSSDEHSLKGAALLIFVGTALLYLPSSVSVGISTFWSHATPFAYETTSSDSWAALIRNVFLIVQLVGTIAFIRGLIILSHAGASHQGNFGKGMAHIIGGIFCINLYEFLQVIFNTLGIG